MFHDELICERVFDCVDERCFLVLNEVGVVGASSVGYVAVEVSYVPVDDADPVHSIFEGNFNHFSSLQNLCINRKFRGNSYMSFVPKNRLENCYGYMSETTEVYLQMPAWQTMFVED